MQTLAFNLKAPPSPPPPKIAKSLQPPKFIKVEPLAPTLKKPLVPKVLVSYYEFEPNQYFWSEEDAERYVQANCLGGKISAISEVKSFRIKVLTPPPSKWEGKMFLCPEARLWGFKSDDELEKFNNTLGHPPFLAKWLCKFCAKWHGWTTLHTGNNGEYKAGAFTIRPYLWSLIERTQKGKETTKTFERKFGDKGY